MNLDFKILALEFTRQHGCPPACIIQEAMEDAASLVIEQATNELHGLRQHLQRLQSGVHPDQFGGKNGQLESPVPTNNT